MTETFRSYYPQVPREWMIKYFSSQLGVHVVERVGHHSPTNEVIIEHLGSRHRFTVPESALHDTWQDAERAVIALHQEEA